MTVTIAVAGKGGVGKTTVAALLIKFLIQNQPGVVLAVDADPSSNLHLSLGLEIEATIGDIREDLLSKVKSSVTNSGAAMGTLPGYSSKREYLDYHIRSSLVEGDKFDLLIMGRPEGPGCYCAVNHNLREVIDSISKNYQYVVIDNEAGMEHLSRRTTRDVNHLIIVSDPTLRSLVAAENIASIANELNINIERKYLLVNRVSGKIHPMIQRKIEEIKIPYLGYIEIDQQMAELDLIGEPVIKIDDKANSYQTIVRLFKPILSI